MRTLSLFFLAAFTVWSASVVSGDLATRKITNSSILSGLKLLGIGVCAYAVYSALGYAGLVTSFLTANFYGLLAVHLFWSALAGIALWYAEIWPAGDAKFFILVSAALPLADPYLKSFPSFLFLSLLINIFVAASFWAVGGYIASGFAAASPSDFFSERWAELKERLTAMARGRNAFAFSAYVLNVGFLFLLQQVLGMEARGFAGRFFARADLLFFFLFILWDKVGDVFRSRRWVYISTASYLVYFFLGFFLFRERLLLLLAGAGVNVVRFSLLLFFGRFMLQFLMEKKDTVFVSAAELEPGMVLSSRHARDMKANPVFEGLFDDCFRDGLSGEQVSALKDWLGKLKVDSPKVEIVRGRPFALWIFAGAALLLALGRNIAGLLK